MPAMLEIEGVTTAYDKADVLQGVSLSVEAGSITCLLGSNGSGKSTLVRSILGLTPSISSIAGIKLPRDRLLAPARLQRPRGTDLPRSCARSSIRHSGR